MLLQQNINPSIYDGNEINTGVSIINDNQNNIDKITTLTNLNISQNTYMDNLNFPNTNSAYSILNEKKNAIARMLYPVGSIAITETNSPPNIPNTTWEIINLKTAIDRSDLFNAYFNTTGLTLTQDSGGKVWFLIFDHNSNSGKNLFTYDTALKCETSGKWSQWWLLKYNDTLFKTDNGTFEFQMMYPDNSSTGMNHFTQTSNPVITNDTVTGYKAISCTWTDKFTGLSYDGTYCLLSGQANTTNWWYAVAPYQNYNSGMPGFGSTVVKGRCQIKIRVPQLENNNIISTLIDHYYWRRVS